MKRVYNNFYNSEMKLMTIALTICLTFISKFNYGNKKCKNQHRPSFKLVKK
mgnify:CR=1 FL=1